MVIFYIFCVSRDKKWMVTSTDTINKAINIVNDICNYHCDETGKVFVTMGHINQYDFSPIDIHTEENSIYTKSFNGDIIVNDSYWMV